MPAAFQYILMRIAVNSLSLLPTPTGIGQYTRQLFSAMGAPAAPPEYSVLLWPELAAGDGRGARAGIGLGLAVGQGACRGAPFAANGWTLFLRCRSWAAPAPW